MAGRPSGSGGSEPPEPVLPHESEDSAPVGTLEHRPRRPARTWRGVEGWLGFAAVTALAISCCCGGVTYRLESVVAVFGTTAACAVYWVNRRATPRGKRIAGTVAIAVAAASIVWNYLHGP